MLLFLPGLVKNLPQAALAAIVITASFRLFDVKELRHLWRVRRSEFFLALVCIFGVTLAGVLEGIVIAIVVSILHFFSRAWRPYATVLGEPKDVAGYHDIRSYPDAARQPGLVILRWDAPIFFANANIFRKLVRDQIAQSSPTPLWILISAAPITDVDTTAADMLVDLDLELNEKGIHLAFAELKDPVREKIERYGLLETIDHRHFYPTLDVAVEAFHQEASQHKQSSGP
jgi:MFS superfamily sulfate permease-like transporter